jgi:AcrR family transcriptional regulator
LLVTSSVRPRVAGRGRGRPVGADSAETRARILRAAREVINERGYEAATFQAIAQRAGLSRPTMHYYFHSREQLYECLVSEAYSIIADSIERAGREDTLLRQLSAFISASRQMELADRSMMRFIITCRLDVHRNPTMLNGASAAVTAVRTFYESIVEGAIKRREIPDDTDPAAVTNMLLARFWGMGFYAGFLDNSNDIRKIAKQLHGLLVHGLLDLPKSDRSLLIDPNAPVSDAVDGFARTWPGLALVIDVPAGQPLIAANGAQPVVLCGDFTRERVRSLLYRAYRVESLVEGIGRYDTLDAATVPSVALDVI